MTNAITARHDLPVWRNDDYYEYPIRIIGVDLTGIVLKMDVRLEGDTPGPPLIALRNVDTAVQGLWLVGVSVVDGVEVSDLRIRMDRATLQALDYTGDFGEAAQFDYALLFGGRTRLFGKLILPPHAFGSDDAPEDRVPSYGVSRYAGVQDAGTTMTISKDGGVTVAIDGADLVSREVLRAEAAADQTSDDKGIVLGIASTSYQSVPTYAAREAIPLNKRGNGMRVQVMEGTPRVFEWRTNLFGPGAWTGLYTQDEVKNLGIDFTGQLPVANVEGLSDVQGAVDDIAAIQIAGFHATALSGAGGKVQIDAKFFGLQPDKIVLSWRGYSVPVKSLPFTPPDQAAIKDFAVSGNSIDDATDAPKWHTILAARRRVASWYTARYSSDGRQTFRAGIDELVFTFAGNLLPAGGTSKAIASINGNSPIDPNSGYAFLNTGADYLTTGVSLAGVVIDLKTGEARHGVASIPNAASAAYSFVQDVGLSAIMLSGPVRFVPDIAAEFARCDNFCGVGNNLFYSGVPNAYGDYTNPSLYEVVDKFAAAAQGNRFLIRDVLPAGEWPADGSPNVIHGVDHKTHMFAATEAWNARNEERHPGSRPRSLPTAGFPKGRTLLKYMQDHGNGSAADNAAIAQGKIPISLWTDGPHPNAAGHVVIADFYEEAMQAQALAPSLPIGTTVTLTATATNPRTGEVIRSLAYAVVQTGDLAALIDPLQNAIDGVVTNSEYRPTIAAAVADFDVDTFFVSDDRDGVTGHPNEKRRYQVTATAPFWIDRGRFVDKSDVGLPEADNTSDASKPVSDAQAIAIDSARADALASTSALGLMTGYALDRRVRTDVAQALSDSEKSVATANIGAVGLGLFDTRVPIVAIEELGGAGDYNPVTKTGTNNDAAFALAAALGVRVQLRPGGRYMTKKTIRPWDRMAIIGDAGYTAAIYGNFDVPAGGGYHGQRVIGSNTAVQTVFRNIVLWGFAIYRDGPAPEHGVLLDNFDGLFVDIDIFATSPPAGGAFGASAFYPECRPSKNAFVRLNRVSLGGNFALQFGNIDGGTMQIGRASECHREVLGLEPYALGKYRFQVASVSSDTINWPNHGLQTGAPLIYSREGATALTGLAAKSNYWFAVVIDANTVKIANSKSQAIAGVTVAIGTAANAGDWHAFIVCGVLRNVTVLGSNIATNDVISGGSGTGTIIITATSGGYSEGVSIQPFSIIERNPSSGSIGIGIFGATNFVIQGMTCIGQKLAAIRAGSGTVNTISNATGSINPKLQDNVTDFGLQVACKGVIRGVNAREFQKDGILIDGDVIVEDCNMTSEVATGRAIVFTQDAEVNKKPFARNCTADIPATVPFATVDTLNASNLIGPIVRQSACRDVNNENVSVDWIAKRRSRQTLVKSIANIAAAGTADANKTVIVALRSSDPNRSVSSFSGTVRIVARQTDSTNTNQATYELKVIKAAGGVAATVNPRSSEGLIAGSAASHPSFAFGINSDGALAAAVIGSTSTTATWLFDIEVSGDLLLA
jgi:hypothetical protein